MDIYNLNTNYKIILGISTITILILIYTYVKNLFNPKKTIKNINIPNNDLLIEGSEHNINNNNNIVEELKRITRTMFSHNDTLKDLLNTSREHHDHINKVNKQKSVPTDKIKTRLYLSIKDDINSGINSGINSNRSEYNFDLSKFYKGRSFKNVTNIKLLEVNIPYVPHNIWKGENNLHNKINYEIDNVNYNIEIDEGYYTINKLINEINNKFTSNGHNILFKHDNNTNQIIIENNDIIDITIIKNPLSVRLGILNNIHIISSKNHISTNIIDLSTRYVDIIFRSHNTPFIEFSKNDDNILKRIYLDGKHGHIIHDKLSTTEYLSQENFNYKLMSKLSTITLIFKRDDGSRYDFKGLDCNLKLEITEHINTDED